jgi:hypothetical protein
MRPPTRSLVAALSGVALLLLGAAPSGATTGSVNSGTLSVNFTPALNLDLAPGTGPCGGPSLLSLDLTTTGASSPYGVSTDLSITAANGDFSFGSTYFLDVDAVGTAGSLTDNGSGADPVATGSLASSGLRGNIYPETAPGSCTPDLATPLCSTVRFSTVVPLSLSGSFPAGATVSPPNVAGTAVLSGSGGFQALGCVAPLSGFNGKTFTFANVDVTF